MDHDETIALVKKATRVSYEAIIGEGKSPQHWSEQNDLDHDALCEYAQANYPGKGHAGVFLSGFQRGVEFRRLQEKEDGA